MKEIEMRNSLAVCLAAIGLSTAALAQAPAFEDVDTNGDGSIDRAEAAAVEGLDFDRADANQDGVIDRAEYQSLSGEEQQ
jgi:hypothetical protein